MMLSSVTTILRCLFAHERPSPKKGETRMKQLLLCVVAAVCFWALSQFQTFGSMAAVAIVVKTVRLESL
jgi:hypothetical protein